MSVSDPDLSDVDLTTEVIRTERLVLRPYRSEDEDAVLAACQDPEVQRWIYSLPSPYTRDDARTYVRSYAPAERAGRRALVTALDAGGVLVGSAGVHLERGLLGPAIGYWLAPGARGRGYAAEATRALADWAFDHGAARTHLFVDVANAASQAVARRAGFTREGVVRSCIPYRDGSRGDAALFARLPGE